MDRLREGDTADSNQQSDAVVVWIARAQTVMMAAGFGLVSALLRGGSLIALATSSLPLWKGLDPIAALLVSDGQRERVSSEHRFARRVEDETDDVGRILDDDSDVDSTNETRHRPT